MSRFPSCAFSFVSAVSFAAALIGLATFVMNPNVAWAAPFAYTGGTYAQDFNTLGSTPQGTTLPWSDGNTLPGWYGFVGGATPTTYTVNRGDFIAQGRLYSLGSVGGTGTNPDSDRALGTQSTTSSTERFGVGFVNSTVSTRDSFTATYDGEQWRRIVNNGADDLIVEYQIFNAGLGSLTAGGTWTQLPGLTFNAPQINNPGASTAIDGNALANRVAGLTATVSDLNWQSGQELWLRFTDTGTAQHILAVDNFSFSTTVAPIPEPSSLLLLSLGAWGMIRKLRRRNR